MKIRQIDKELEYIDQILVTDNSKLKIFKAKYAWLSSPEMIMNLSKKYLAANGSFDIGLDASRTYNFAAFSLKVKPRLLTSVNSKLVE
ncbi:MAG: hypothetical protein ISQ32_04295 [Rickettsiales bacterium]|nr:hypothetical protein [Rickettsiales bacterium]